MLNSTKNMIKGMGVGMTVGIMLTAGCCILMKGTTGIRKKMGKTVRAVTDFINEMQAVMR